MDGPFGVHTHVSGGAREEILRIRAAMNLGLTDSLREDFPDILPVERPKLLNQEIKDPY